MAIESIGATYGLDFEAVAETRAQRPVEAAVVEPTTVEPAEQARVASEAITTSDELQVAWSDIAGQTESEAGQPPEEIEPVQESYSEPSAGPTSLFSASSSWRAAAAMFATSEPTPAVEPASPAPAAQASAPSAEASDLAAAQARYHEYRLSMPDISEFTISGDNDITSTRPPTEAERLAFASDFVDPQTGMTGAEIQRLEQAAREARTPPPSSLSGYGLNDQDRALLADPDRPEARARYDAYRATAPDVMTHWISGDNDGFSLLPPNEAQRDEFASDFVDLPTGITGTDLQHLDRALIEQRQGDEATRKLEAVNLGSFTDNKEIESVPAERAFSVIGQDQREALMAEGFTTLGKAFVLEDGRMILPDEHETGVYFISSVSANALASGGVIDTGNGGYNIDGLYLDGGNATIGTTRPTGGLFGSLLNHLDHLLPGGKLGELAGDAISDLNKLVNMPIRQGLELVGQDDGFLGQVVGHQEATVDVVAHASETGNQTFAELTKRTAEFDQVDRVAYQVGQALVATGVGTIIGVGIMTVAGANMAGHAQLLGDKDADPNQGLIAAAQTFALAQAGGALGNSAQAGVTSVANEAGGVLAEYSGQLGTAAKNLVTGATNQLGTTGEVDLTSLLAGQAAGLAGVQVEGAVGDFATGAGVNADVAGVLGDLAGGFTRSTVNQALATGQVDLETALLGAAGEATEIGDTGVNAVQLVQLGEALNSGDSAQVGNLLVGGITSFSTRGGQSAGSNPDFVGPQALEGSEGTDAPQTLSGTESTESTEGTMGPVGPEPELRLSDSEVEELLRSQGGAERVEGARTDVFTTDRGEVVTMVTDAEGRARMTSRQTSGPGGSTVVTSFGESGAADSQRTSFPNGLVVERTAGSSTLSIETARQDRAGFNQAFAAAREAGAGLFTWNGRSYTTELAPDRPETIHPTPQQIERAVAVGPGATPQQLERLVVDTNRVNTPPPIDRSSITTVDQFASYVSWLENKYPEVSNADMTRVLRQTFYSGTGQSLEGAGGQNNSSPLIFETLGRLGEQPTSATESMTQFLGRAGDALGSVARGESVSIPDLLLGPAPPVGSRLQQLQQDVRGLPTIVRDTNGELINIGHAMVGLDGLTADRNGSRIPEPGRAAAVLLNTHLGDLGQAFGAAVYFGGAAVMDAFQGAGNVLAAVNRGGDVGQVANLAVQSNVEAWRRAYLETTGAASSDQLRGNQRGLEVGLLAAPFTSTSSLIRQLDRTTPPPNLSDLNLP